MRSCWKALYKRPCLLKQIDAVYISCGKYAIYLLAQPLFCPQTYYVYEFPCNHIPRWLNFMFSQGLLMSHINLFLSFERKNKYFLRRRNFMFAQRLLCLKTTSFISLFSPPNRLRFDFNLLSRCALPPQMSHQDFYHFLMSSLFLPPNFSNLCSLCRLMPAK